MNNQSRRDKNACLAKKAASFYNYPSKKLCMIGVTGTNGKTSCVQFIAQALNQLNPGSCATLGTLGIGWPGDLKPSKLTTPSPEVLQKSLASFVEKGASYVAMEVSSHAIDQARIACIDFDYAVFTNLSRDHLDYHKNFQCYGETKAKLFQSASLKGVVINVNDDWGQILSKDARIVAASKLGFSVKKNHLDMHFPCCYMEIDEEKRPYLVVKPQLSLQASSQFWIATKLLGDANAENLLATLTLLYQLGFAWDKILEVIPLIKPIPGRLQICHQNPLVIVDYAHTPDALRQLLIALGKKVSGRLWCVFGCGGDRDKGKRAEMGCIAEKYSNKVILTYDNPRHESPSVIIQDILKGFNQPDKVHVINDRALAIGYALEQANEKDTVVIAGKGHETYQQIGEKHFYFNDAKLVEAFY